MPMIQAPGGFEFLTEAVPGEAGDIVRTTFASGPVVNRRTAVDRVATPEPLSSVGMGGNAHMQGMNRGHLIGLNFGGPNISANVVPMYAYFNKHGDWKNFERELENMNLAGKKLSIRINYDELGPSYRPSHFEIKLTESAKPFPIRQWMLVMRRRTVAPYEIDPNIRLVVEGVMEPADYEATDYGFLDDKRPELGLGPANVATEFDGVHREIIKTVNALRSIRRAARNGTPQLAGILTSDDPRDFHQLLNSYGDDDAPEVDHIRPRSLGGSNAFSNARLVSYKSNNRKRTRVDDQEIEAIRQEGTRHRDARPKRARTTYATRS